MFNRDPEEVAAGDIFELQDMAGNFWRGARALSVDARCPPEAIEETNAIGKLTRWLPLGRG